MTLLEQARDFRVAFGQEIPGCISRYGFIKKALWDMQVGLINEESCEFLEAAEECFADPENAKRREELLKELSDIVFVCYQFACAFGLDLDTAMDRVFESNMSKLDDDGKPIYRADGKVLKSKNYFPPTLTDLVSATQTFDAPCSHE